MDKVNHETSGKKVYAAPAAEIVLLAPCEGLAAWDFKFHNYDDRWAIGQWADFGGLGDPLSGIIGTGTLAELEKTEEASNP